MARRVYVTLPHLVDAMRRLPDAVDRAAVRGIQDGARASIPILRRRTERARPASSNGLVGATASYRYFYNWKTAAEPDGAAIYNDQPYASTIELGQARGAPPPPTENLVRWLVFRFGYDAADPRTWSAARGIALSISKRGLLPRRVMIDAVPEVADEIHDHVVRAIEKELRSL